MNNNHSEKTNNLLYVYTNYVLRLEYNNKKSKADDSDAERAQLNLSTFFNPYIKIDDDSAVKILVSKNEKANVISVKGLKEKPFKLAKFVQEKKIWPNWFQNIHIYQIKLLCKLFNHLEKTLVISLNLRLMTDLMEQCGVGFVKLDVSNVVNKYWPKSRGGYVDFDEFLFHLATYEDQNIADDTSVLKADDYDGSKVLEKHKFCFSAIVVFSCASTMAYLGLNSMFYSNYLSIFFHAKNNDEIQLLSNKMSFYRKLQLEAHKKHAAQTSPYLRPLKFISINPIPKNEGLNLRKIVNILHESQLQINDEQVLQDCMKVMAANKCIVARLPNVYNISVFREVFGLLNPFDALCTSNVKKQNSKRIIEECCSHFINLHLFDRKRIQKNKIVKFHLPNVPFNIPPVPDPPVIPKCLLPKLVGPVMNRIIKETDNFYNEIRIRSAARNMQILSRFPLNKFEEFESNKLPIFLQTFYTYKPVDPKYIYPHIGTRK